MAHFAQLDENNVVTDIIVVGNDEILDSNGEESEELGIAFCKNHAGADTNWKQASYSNKIRFRYPGVGYSYNSELDAFIEPKPFASWTLDTETATWVSPAGAAPALTEADIAARRYYVWNEETLSWTTASIS